MVKNGKMGKGYRSWMIKVIKKETGNKKLLVWRVCGGRTHSLGGEGGRGSIWPIWKTPDTALYSTYERTLWFGGSER